MRGGPTVGRGAAAISVGLMAFGPSIVKTVDMAEMAFVFWRLTLASALYAVIQAVVGKRISWADLRRSALGGVVFAVNLIFFILSMRRTSAVNAVVIASLQPVVLLAAGVRLFGERPHRSVYGWSVLAFCGVVLSMVAADASGVATLGGDLLALVTMLLFAAYYVISKRARADMDSSTYQLSLTLVATATLAPFALIYEGGLALPTAGDWWLVAAMAVIPGTGHLLANFAHGHASLTMVSLINLGFTAIAPLYAWWLVGERIGAMQAVGIGLVLVALGFVVTRPVEVVGR
jgi:drug/metabolite transporter (DMT)-like permease